MKCYDISLLNCR